MCFTSLKTYKVSAHVRNWLYEVSRCTTLYDESPVNKYCNWGDFSARAYNAARSFGTEQGCKSRD